MTQKFEKSIPNPPEKFMIYFSLGISIIILLFNIILGFITGSLFLLCVNGLIISSLIFLFLGWYGEYFHRPKVIEIQDDGLLLLYRYSKPKFILYSQILALGGREDWGGGGLIPSEGQVFHITYELFTAIRDAYFEKFGTYPMEWNGRDGAKEFKRRHGL